MQIQQTLEIAVEDKQNLSKVVRDSGIFSDPSLYILHAADDIRENNPNRYPTVNDFYRKAFQELYLHGTHLNFFVLASKLCNLDMHNNNNNSNNSGARDEFNPGIQARRNAGLKEVYDALPEIHRTLINYYFGNLLN